jgi:hypothetical protein
MVADLATNVFDSLVVIGGAFAVGGASGWIAGLVAQAVAPERDLTHALGRGVWLRADGNDDARGSLLLGAPVDRPIVRRDMRRELKIFLAGTVLTVVYVTIATAVGWHGWLIAVVGIALGVIYGLIATPLALGPTARLRTTEHETDERQLLLPGVVSAEQFGLSVYLHERSRRLRPTGRAVRTHH